MGEFDDGSVESAPAWGWGCPRLIDGFGRMGVSNLLQLALLTTLSGRIMGRILRRFLVSYGGARQFLLQCLWPGGCWKTSLLLGSILVEEGCS